MLSRLIDRLEARIGRHRGIHNLMTIVVIGTIIVYLADYILPIVSGGTTLSSLLYFNRDRILRGEVWRVITFVFVPTGGGNLLLMAISLYFDWLMGSMLQNHWGTFRFTLFYTTGMLGAVLSGCITGYADAYYLNTSLMLTMACIHPEMPLQLYGILTLRLKWLAVISLAMMLLQLLPSFSWYNGLALVAALINVAVFVFDRLLDNIRNAWRHYQWKQNWRNGWKR
ncbi:MAG: hypothetical protein IJE07_07860 [Clostridia bacterium]|nr:hypothetical protein [Clostridia bacterium]